MKIKFYNGWGKSHTWDYMPEADKHYENQNAEVQIFPKLSIQRRFRFLKFQIFGLYLQIEFYKQTLFEDVKNNQV